MSERCQQRLRRLGAGALLALALPSWAGVPVIHDGEREAVRRALSEQTGLPSDQFELQSVKELRRLAPRVVGAATLRHCSGPPTRAADLRALQVRAAAALRSGETAVAQDHLDLGIAGLGCLGEPVEAGVGAQLFLLRGAMHAETGHPERAQAELQTALALDPELRWPDGLGAEHAALLDETRAVVPRAELSVTPPPRGAAPWVDGRPVQSGVVLRPGLHLVQIPSTSGLHSAWLTIRGNAALVVVDSLRPARLDGIASKPPDRHSLRIVQAVADGPSAYVVRRGGIWLVELEGDKPVVTELRAPAAAEPLPGAVLESPPRKRRRRR